ncbi:MAG: SUMF1/EgtB/PvdO family nonheme iron enzyme [Planctomycetota bacterium]|nr:SUMF1/EgtB/PvdO family nonheme iron enzyme [Planctomycetota bacterium]
MHTGDIEQKKLELFTTKEDIQKFVMRAANLVKFREFYEKAQEHYKNEKLNWALTALEKALSFAENEMARELLVKWRKESLPEGFVFLEGDKFSMGQSNKVFSDDYRQYPAHPVIVSDFAIGIYEVTNDDFAEFIKATNYETTVESKGGVGFVWDEETQKWQSVEGVAWNSPKGKRSNIRRKGKHPVVQISWKDAEEYCVWRSAKEGVPEGTIRLVTEAQWEYAARGKYGTKFPWGDEPPFTADGKQTTGFAVVDAEWHEPVGSIKKGVSPDGVYDLIGNVWEWCYDRSSDVYYKACKDSGVITDPEGPPVGILRSVRGGGYDSDIESARATKRFFVKEDQCATNIGFRLAFNF